MAAVVGLLNYVVSVLLSLLGLTQSRADQITVNKILAILTDPVVGLNAVHGEFTTVLADLASVQGDVLALGSPQQSGAVVTLPSTPPAGYGGASASAAAAAVWAASVDGGYVAGGVQGTLGRMTDLISGGLGFFAPGNPWLVVRVNLSPTGTYPLPGFSPEVNPKDILPTDATVGDWLQRAYPAWNWNNDSDANWWWTYYNHPNGAQYYVTITDGQLDYFKHFLYTPSSGPPQRSTLGDLAQIEGLIPVQYS